MEKDKERRKADKNEKNRGERRKTERKGKGERKKQKE